MRSSSSFRIGYLMQNGAPDMSTLSGPQLHVLAVVKGFQQLRHEVRILTTRANELAWSDDLRNWASPQIGLTGKRWFRLAESALRRIQYEFRLPFFGLFDSLHYADACCHSLKGCDLLYERHGYMGFGGVIAARLLNIPLIIELNGNIVKEIDERGLKMSPRQRSLGRWLTRRTWLAADHLVAVSEGLKRQVIATFKIPEERVSVVQNGVDVDLFSQSFDEGRTREEFRIGPGPVVAFVGSFQPWHGVGLLLSSFGRVQSKFPQSQLILVGGGEGQDLVDQSVSLGLDGKVRFLGLLPQHDVAAVLSFADVVVAPYPFKHTEIVGTPLKILEYMAAGKGIVASTAPIHEIIADGVTGLRVEPADPDALAEAICRLLGDQDLRCRLGASARREAQSHYSWANAVKKLETIIEQQFLQQRYRSPASKP